METVMEACQSPAVCAFLRAQGLEPKELQTVCHRPGHVPSLVLLRCRRGAKPGLVMLPELTLYGPDGAPTPAFRRIYHMDEGGLS